jgi:hypothetical protein
VDLSQVQYENVNLIPLTDESCGGLCGYGNEPSGSIRNGSVIILLRNGVPNDTLARQ